MSTLKAGIIGCGVIAPTHAEALKAQKDVEIKWACDLLSEKASALSEKYAIPHTTTDYNSVIQDPNTDFVCVCTDHASHAQICADALEAGRHVLCEKALSASSEGIDRMLAVHAKYPYLKFGGIFQHRFDAANQYIAGLVKQNAFGTALTAGLRMYCKRTNAYYEADSWRGTWALEGGGVIINQAIHYIDLLTWLTGGVESVCGTHSIRTHQDVIETEDTVTASIRFRSGALGVLEATSSSDLNWHPTFWIHGSAGRIELCNGKTVDLAFSDKELETRVRNDLAECRDRPGVRTRKSYYGTGHAAQIEDFVSAVRNDHQPFVTALQAAHAVDVVLGIYRSQKEDKWIKIPNRQSR